MYQYTATLVGKQSGHGYGCGVSPDMAELQDLLSEVQTLSGLQQARIASIMGALVADAAAQPTHWVYKPEAMKKAVSECPDTPEFLPVSVNPFYCIPTGSQSPYGDQLMAMLESLVECKGFDAKKNAEKMFLSFGPNSPYDSTLSSSYSKTQTDRSMYPIKGKWQSFLLRRFTKCHSEGRTVQDLKEDDKNVDPDGLVRNIPLVAMLAGKLELLDMLQESALQLQTNDMIVVLMTAVARVIEYYILHEHSSHQDESSPHPLERVIQDLKRADRACPDDLDLAMAGHFKKVLECKDLTVDGATQKFGKA